MRSTDFPFAVTPQGYAVRRFDKGGPSFADRARQVAKGATFAFNDEIEAGLRALMQLDPAAYQREVARIRAQQKAYEDANPYESAGLEIGGALLPALLPGAQGLAGARMASLAAKAPRAARIAPVVGEAALYGVGAADSMADIPRSVASEGAQALAMYGAGAAAAPRLKALGAKVAARLRPNKANPPAALAVKPQDTPKMVEDAVERKTPEQLFLDMASKGRMRTDAHNDRANVDLVVKGEKPATNINLDFDDLDDDTDSWWKSLPSNLFIIDHPKQLGEVIVAKTKEDAMRVANADTNYAFGKAYGYSDNDIAHFYDRRFGPSAYKNWIADREDWLSQNPSKPTKKAKGGFAVKKGR
jgi:hypothetical protein